MSAEQLPFFTIFLTGQPMLTSIPSKPSAANSFAERK